LAEAIAYNLGEPVLYSDEFVWLHFPKCAGTKVENLFRTYYSFDKRIFQDVVDPILDPQATWHDSISDREERDPGFILGNRIVICSFRRLPTWLESRYSFEFQRSPQLSHRPELLLEGKFLEPTGEQSHADFYARTYISEYTLISDKIRFIRTEYFESDFKHVFGEFLDVTVIPDWEFGKRDNVSESAVPNKIRKKLFQNQQEVYENVHIGRRLKISLMDNTCK
jgi:hypothetical protein